MVNVRWLGFAALRAQWPLSDAISDPSVGDLRSPLARLASGVTEISCCFLFGFQSQLATLRFGKFCLLRGLALGCRSFLIHLCLDTFSLAGSRMGGFFRSTFLRLAFFGSLAFGDSSLPCNISSLSCRLSFRGSWSVRRRHRARFRELRLFGLLGCAHPLRETRFIIFH